MVEKISGPVCSKLITSLVNLLLNFQTLISRICTAKASLICSTKNISVFSKKSHKILNELTS